MDMENHEMVFSSISAQAEPDSLARAAFRSQPELCRGIPQLKPSERT